MTYLGHPESGSGGSFRRDGMSGLDYTLKLDDPSASLLDRRLPQLKDTSVDHFHTADITRKALWYLHTVS